MEPIHKNKLQEINKLIFVQDYERADRELTTLAKDSDEVIVHVRRIELALKLDRVKPLVLEFAEKFQSSGNSLHHALTVLCKQFGEMQSSFDCIAEYQTILKSDPSNVICYYGIAIAMEQRSMFDRAVYNYSQALQVDPQFFPANFGLSQVYYHQENYEQGDYYFYLFESAAPFNVYGNFETHRNLSREYIQREEYNYAARAASTLSSWWQENKSFVPREISIFENLAYYEISRAQGETGRAEEHYRIARQHVDHIVDSNEGNEGVLYFIAKIFEDYAEDQATVMTLFEKIISDPSVSAELVQKIAGQLFAHKKYEIAFDLLTRAYRTNPDHSDLRFCLMVSKLKLSKLDVEEYLADKDRLNHLVSSGADRVEILSLLHSLYGRFKDDPEIHAHLSHLYLRLGNYSKADYHIEKMYELDPLGKNTLLRYADFLLKKQDFKGAQQQLDLLKVRANDAAFSKELLVQQIDVYQKQAKHAEALQVTGKLLRQDPWDMHLLVKQHHSQFHLTVADKLDYSEDSVLAGIDQERETKDKDWQQFDRLTEIYESQNFFELVYLRRKIRFVFSYGKGNLLKKFLESASRYDVKQGIHDFLHLINTNFDSPEVYWALGMLYKQLWQLETAISWFEQATQHPRASNVLLADAYKEIADSYNWGNHNYDKAMEYGQLALGLQHVGQHDLHGVLAHSYMKQGKVRQARLHLDKAEEGDVEAEFLKGLLCYRDGQEILAKKHWKPLLTSQSFNVKIYHIKQEIHRYYFREQEYLKAN